MTSIADDDLVRARLDAEGLPSLDQMSDGQMAEAVPTLLDLAARVSTTGCRFALARAAVRGRFEPADIVNGLRAAAERGESDRIYLWTLAEGLSTSKRGTDFDELADLTRDRRLGDARKMLLAGACSHRDRREDAIRLCVECLADEVVASMAIPSLLKLEAPNLHELIAPLAESKHALTAREAKKALRKLKPKSKTVRFRRVADDDVLPGPAEWSSNFDESDLKTVLVRTAQLQGDPLGFRDLEVALAEVESLSHDEAAAFVLQAASPVGIVFYVAGEGALDITFFGCSETVARIEDEFGEPG